MYQGVGIKRAEHGENTRSLFHVKPTTANLIDTSLRRNGNYTVLPYYTILY